MCSHAFSETLIMLILSAHHVFPKAEKLLLWPLLSGCAGADVIKAQVQDGVQGMWQGEGM